jgi:hypothetical protein
MWHVWGERKGTYRVLVRKPEVRRATERDGRIILKWTLIKSLGGQRWIDLPQNRDKWQIRIPAP